MGIYGTVFVCVCDEREKESLCVCVCDEREKESLCVSVEMRDMRGQCIT